MSIEIPISMEVFLTKISPMSKKRLSVIDSLLLGLILIEGTGICFQLVQLNKLRADYGALSLKLREMPPTSPDEIAFLQIPTDEPLSFAWRVRVPKSKTFQFIKSDCQGSSSTSTFYEGESLLRIKFRIQDGAVDVYSATNVTQSVMTFLPKNPNLIQILRSDNPDRAIQLITSENDFVKPPTDKPFDLLKIEMDDSKETQSAGEVTESKKEIENSCIFRIRIEPGP